MNESIWPECDMLSEWDTMVSSPDFNYELDYAAWGQRWTTLAARTAVDVRTGADNPISADPAIRVPLGSRTSAVDCCQALGRHTCRPYHSLGRVFRARPNRPEWEWGVEAMRDMAPVFDSAAITTAIEL
jgi:hypothetical protein